MAGERCRFRRDAFHQIAVSHNAVNAIIHNIKVWPVILRGHVSLSDCHANAVGKTLAERTGCRFNSGCQMIFRMAWSFAPELTKIFQVIK